MHPLYVYVDESGQDPLSEVFVVVAVVSAQEQEKLRTQLEGIECEVGTGRKKWHKVRHKNRMEYLTTVLKRRIAAGGVYVSSYHKPIPHAFPFIDTLERCIKETSLGHSDTRVYVDGIDRRKAKELTNALRARGISLHVIKSRRDESEPMIRLADMWAGCARSAYLRHQDTRQLLEQAERVGYLLNVSPS